MDLYIIKEEMVDIIKSWKNIQIDGVFSHFSIAFYGNGKESKEQFNRYMQCVDTLKNNNINTGMLHICNSSAFLSFNDMHLDAVRIGSAFAW
ncbi:MAG: alanine racemase [Clostridia bacterium]